MQALSARTCIDRIRDLRSWPTRAKTRPCCRKPEHFFQGESFREQSETIILKMIGKQDATSPQGKNEPNHLGNIPTESINVMS